MKIALENWLVEKHFNYKGFSFDFILPKGDHITNKFVDGQIYEQDLIEELLRLVAPYTLMLDVGAFFGTHGAILGALLDLPVYMVEPNEKAMKWADINLLRNGINCMGKCPKVVAIDHGLRFGLNDGLPNNLGSTSFQKSRYGFYESIGAHVLTNQVYEACQTLSLKTGLIKIDAENQSHEILPGFTKLMHAHKPVVVIESAKSAVDYMMDSVGYYHHGQFCDTPTHIYLPKQR